MLCSWSYVLLTISTFVTTRVYIYISFLSIFSWTRDWLGMFYNAVTVISEAQISKKVRSCSPVYKIKVIFGSAALPPYHTHTHTYTHYDIHFLLGLQWDVCHMHASSFLESHFKVQVSDAQKLLSSPWVRDAHPIYTYTPTLTQKL